MWRRCVRTVLAETTSSDAISDASRLLGRYLTTRSSASLSSSRSGAAGPRRGAARPASTSRIVEISVAWAVRWLGVALEQLADRPRARTAGSGPSGSASSSARSIDCLRRARIAELVAGRGVEQQRVDASPSARTAPAREPLDHRRQRLDRAAPGRPSASSSAAAAMRIPARSRSSGLESGERGARRGRVAHPHLRTCSDPAAHVDRERVLAGEQPLQPLRARGTPPALPRTDPAPKRSKPRAWWSNGLGLGLRRRRAAHRSARSSHCARPRAKRPSHASAHAGHRERAGATIGCVRPSVLLGDRHRLLAQLERERQRLPGERRRDREVREAADLDERPPDPARAAERVLEVLPCVVGMPRPQLGDAEVHERERPDSAVRGSSCVPLAAERCLQRAHRLPRAGRDRRADGRAAASTTARYTSKTRRRSSGTVAASRSRDGEVGGAVVEKAVEEPSIGERQRRAPRRRQRASAGKAASSARSVARPAIDQRRRSCRPAGARPCGQSPAACAWRIASTTSPCSSNQRPRRGAATGSSPARRAAARAAAGRRTGGGSETTYGATSSEVTNAFCVLEPLEDRLGSRAAGQRVGQRAADALEHRGAQQQVAHLRRLALQHLGEQVARHGALAAARTRSRSARGPGARRARSPPGAGPPAIPRCARGASATPASDSAIPLAPEQRARLLQREAQVGARASRSARPASRSRCRPSARLLARRAARPAAAAAAAPAAARATASASAERELVQVVDHQHDRLFEPLEVRQQPLDHRRAREARRRADPLDDLVADRIGERVDQPTARTAAHHARRVRPRPRRRPRPAPPPTSAAARSCRSPRARRRASRCPERPLTAARREPGRETNRSAEDRGCWQSGQSRSRLSHNAVRAQSHEVV